MSATKQTKRRTVKTICEAHHINNTLEPLNRRHVLAQLSIEGTKRLESFLFEKIFKTALERILLPDALSLDWIIQFYKGQLKYWFKICTPQSQLSSADKKLISHISDTGGEVLYVGYDVNLKQFYSARADNAGGYFDIEPLDKLLAKLSGHTTRNDFETSSYLINAQRQQVALEYLNKYFSNEELFNLSLNRLLIQCYLLPWFGNQPVDIDACAVIDGHLAFFEFKRKYPFQKVDKGTKMLLFGIDSSIDKIVRWAASNSVHLYHIVLVDALAREKESPTHLLIEDSSTINHAYWLGKLLIPASYKGIKVYTEAHKSGMKGGRRSQDTISIDEFFYLGNGLYPSLLSEFLNNTSNLENASYEFWYKSKQAANKAFDDN